MIESNLHLSLSPQRYNFGLCWYRIIWDMLILFIGKYDKDPIHGTRWIFWVSYILMYVDH